MRKSLKDCDDIQGLEYDDSSKMLGGVCINLCFAPSKRTVQCLLLFTFRFPILIITLVKCDSGFKVISF